MSKDRQQIARVALRKQVADAAGRACGSEQGDLNELSERHGVPALDLSRTRLPLELLEQIPREIAERHQLLPVSLEGEELVVAMVDPGDARCLEELSFVMGKRVVPLVVPVRDLKATLEQAYLAHRRGERYFLGPRYEGETTEPETPEFRSSDRVPVPLPELGLPVLENDPAISEGAIGECGQTSSDLVLVVDDDESVLALMRTILTQEGYDVAVAGTGPEALELLKTLKPVAMVLDAMLPGLHGFEIIRRLRGSRRFSGLPVVMVSALHRGWEIAEDVRALGAVDYVEKPFRANTLLRAVAQAVGGESQESSLIRPEAEAELEAGLDAFKQGKAEVAVEHLRRGTELDPGSAELQLQLGLVLGRCGRHFEAMGALECALELMPRDFVCAKSLAILYEQSGFFNKSVQLWQRAIRLAPDGQTRSSIERRLQSLSQAAANR